jgi:hypothetical protein
LRSIPNDLTRLPQRLTMSNFAFILVMVEGQRIS